MSQSVNSCTFVGRLTRDPELRYTNSGLAVCSFSIAVDRRGKVQEGQEKKTDFFRCTAWRQQAEFIKEWIGKGRLVYVQGAVEINQYEDKDGATRTSVDLQVDNIVTLDPKPQGDADEKPRQAQGNQRQGNGHGGAAQAPAQQGFVPAQQARQQQQPSLPATNDFDQAFN